jgi:hypothetical protein
MVRIPVRIRRATFFAMALGWAGNISFTDLFNLQQLGVCKYVNERRLDLAPLERERALAPAAHSGI